MIEHFIALCGATALLLGSPGPAPLALAATSASFGIRKSLPFLCGILAGLVVVIVLAIAGVATLLANWPTLKFALQICGAAYICFVAIKIATGPIAVNKTDETKLPSMVDGFVLNILNPKAYAAFLAIFSQFLLPSDELLISYLLTGLVCMFVAVIVDSGWVVLGRSLRSLFSHSRYARFIRVLFGLMMVCAVGIAMWI